MRTLEDTSYYRLMTFNPMDQLEFEEELQFWYGLLPNLIYSYLKLAMQMRYDYIYWDYSFIELVRLL